MKRRVTLLVGSAAAAMAVAGCGGGSSSPTVTVTTTVTATPGAASSQPADPSAGPAGAIPFGKKPGGETYPGLWISVAAPKHVSLPDAYPETRGRTIVLAVTQSNSTEQTLDIQSAATEAHVREAQKPCVQLFAQRPHLEANATGTVLPGRRRTFLVGFACDGKAGDLLTVTAWAQDPKVAAETQQNPEHVTFGGQMP